MTTIQRFLNQQNDATDDCEGKKSYVIYIKKYISLNSRKDFHKHYTLYANDVS